jgi:hypothetical protein
MNFIEGQHFVTAVILLLIYANFFISKHTNLIIHQGNSIFLKKNNNKKMATSSSSSSSSAAIPHSSTELPLPPCHCLCGLTQEALIACQLVGDGAVCTAFRKRDRAIRCGDLLANHPREDELKVPGAPVTIAGTTRRSYIGVTILQLFCDQGLMSFYGSTGK